ncbi:MAG: hypothetical protein DRO87_09225 [Candidatus Thorarchaeota archaeon]|nr:MAG: hypothetical protein DRO87_09225 [Candidatus Thorarchaeota archaeon]RLI55347.1 MAG: hypothetical protein DRP09_10025 [Candidatus Thorarchaeota archaeon]
MKYGDEHLDISGMQVSIARAISRVTPAPLVNLYVAVILALWSPIGLGPVLSPLLAILICVALMVVIPVLPIMLEAWRGSVDLDVSAREQRAKFFMFSLVCYVLAYAIYTVLECPIMSSLAVAYFFVTLGIMLVSFKTKVSVHVAGVAGPGTGLIVIFGVNALPVILLWIVVGWARTVLRQHSPTQSLTALILAVVISYISYSITYVPYV